MKKTINYLVMTMLAFGTLFYSCETVELEDLTSPNALSPTQADVDLLLNSIQRNYLFSMRSFNGTGALLGRIEYMGGLNYFNNFGSGTVSGPWNNLYNGIIPDISAIEEQHTTDNDLSFHLGVSKLMQGQILMLLVDYLGDVVYTEANNPAEFPTPKLDDGQGVYTAAITVIDEAIGYLNAASGPGSATDLFYGGDITKWIKLANTVKMRANLTTGNYAAVLAATNVISSTEDDLEFKYGTNELSPDNRHPWYAADYRSDGANKYQSNWLMDLMVSEHGTIREINGDLVDPAGSTDPRRRYYFFRQNWNTPNNRAYLTDVEGRFGPAGEWYPHDQAENAETLQCSGETTLPHLEFTPDENTWCTLSLGYWGRSHGNSRGTPPDNFLRTASGVYPAGGSFDGNNDAAEFKAQFDSNDNYIGYVASTVKLYNQSVGLGKGGGGAGVSPIILASYVEFWRAEANLMLGNAAAASTNIENALTISIAKVQSFGALDGGADMSQAPDAAMVSAFIARVKSEFDAADMTTALNGVGFPVAKDKMDILSEQYFVTMFGAGADAFNFIRRTGYPRSMVRSWSPAPGNFPRTVLYPGNEVGANPNILQRTDLDTKVFWDQGITSPAN